MTVKTNYNVGDTVYTVNPDTLTIIKGEVTNIMVWVSETSPSIRYSIDIDGKSESFDQCKCFRTKDELLEHLTWEL